MAHIFKNKKESSFFSKALGIKNKTGILIFTHKEKRWINQNPNIQNQIIELHKSFYIGVHYGHRMLDEQKASYEDFCMGANSVVEFSSTSPFRIPLNSRAFTPSFFKKMNAPKFYDIINISRNITLKKLDVFLSAVRKIYDEGKLYKFLLIVPSTESEKDDGNYFLDIVHEYNSLFSRKEREFFTLIRLSKEHGFLGISPLTISYLYNSSKIFTLLSPGEGESRVIHEALLCGLPVVCYKELYGGGRDYLTPLNSLQFDDYGKVAETFIKAIEEYDKFQVDTETLALELSEENSLLRLNEYFSKLFQIHGNEFDGNLINTDYLNLRLPAHYMDVPWKSTNLSATADILTEEQFLTFKEYL